MLYGEAVDWEGNPVLDADGNKILYPRVGESNGSMDDLPVRLDKEGFHNMMKANLSGRRTMMAMKPVFFGHIPPSVRWLWMVRSRKFR